MRALKWHPRKSRLRERAAIRVPWWRRTSNGLPGRAGWRVARVGQVKTKRLRISLHEVTPTVLRVIDVPDELTLAELHPVLQAALGWTDSHLHEYTAGARTY